jgi:hypothetical protein
VSILCSAVATKNVDASLSDVSLAAYGRKEIEIAEVC